MNAADFEKLGLFYLGRQLDEARRPTPAPFLLEARELLTHAVIAGMTGSGKTGLGVTLLEEAAIDGIPAVIVDPKGDLANLALTFPDLSPADFLPWIDAEEARRQGVSVEELAARTAEAWRAGLAEHGQAPARIARLRQAAEVTVYTPGARLGRPLALLRSFEAPPAALRDAPDLVRERAVSAAAGLLGLAGIEADPVKSRELLLVSTLLERSWAEGRSLTLADVVRGVNEPPFDKVGLFDLESFFPAKARFELALALNHLLASPGFAAWTEGEPLDVARLLRGDGGRPRLAVLSIAHLSDAQRMFFVTALLGEMVAWMRAQPGSGHLRALLYMDEIFGYFPPSATPPSKQPMLTLLKQARAFGLGVVLATQNPVDLDYKGLGNAGTWMIGRLQTARDKARILDGLEGASALSGAGFDRARMDALIGSLEPRQFLVHSVHQSGPALMQTRWALSWLRGPLSREQLAKLAGPVADAAPAPAEGPVSLDALAGAPAPERAGGERPVLPPEVTELFAAASPGARYGPWVLGSGRVHITSRAAGVDEWRTVALAAPLADEATLTIGADDVDWAVAEAIAAGTSLERRPVEGARFAPLPAAAARPASYARWRRALEAHLMTAGTSTLWRSRSPAMISRPGESEAQFRGRLAEAVLAGRAEAAARLRARYRPRVAAAEARVSRATDKVSRQSAQAEAQTVDTAVSVGSTILGAIFGRRGSALGHVGRARSAARSATRAAKERGDVALAEEELARERAAFDALEAEVTEAVRKIDDALDPSALVLEPIAVRPKKADVSVGTVALLWRPS